MVWLERGAQGRFKTGMDGLIGPVQIHLQPKWQGVTIKYFQGLHPWVDSIVGFGIGINVSLYRKRCRGGGIIRARVWLERGSQGSFKNSAYC